MTASISDGRDGEFWGPVDERPDPVVDVAPKSPDVCSGLPAPILDLPERRSEVNTPLAPVADLTDPWAVGGADVPALVLDLPDRESSREPDAFGSMIDLRPPDAGFDQDRPDPMVLDLGLPEVSPGPGMAEIDLSLSASMPALAAPEPPVKTAKQAGDGPSPTGTARRAIRTPPPGRRHRPAAGTPVAHRARGWNFARQGRGRLIAGGIAAAAVVAAGVFVVRAGNNGSSSDSSRLVSAPASTSVPRPAPRVPGAISLPPTTAAPAAVGPPVGPPAPAASATAATTATTAHPTVSRAPLPSAGSPSTTTGNGDAGPVDGGPSVPAAVSPSSGGRPPVDLSGLFPPPPPPTPNPNPAPVVTDPPPIDSPPTTPPPTPPRPSDDICRNLTGEALATCQRAVG